MRLFSFQPHSQTTAFLAQLLKTTRMKLKDDFECSEEPIKIGR